MTKSKKEPFAIQMIHVGEMLIAKILTQVNYLENFPIVEISTHFVTMFNVIKLEKQLL